MYQQGLQDKLDHLLGGLDLDLAGKDHDFYIRLVISLDTIEELYQEIYSRHRYCSESFHELLGSIVSAYLRRSGKLKTTDQEKKSTQPWFLSHELCGMSLYVDRFNENLKGLAQKLQYFTTLGVNVLHLMPLFESPALESDGGYAVSDFKKIDPRFGTLADLESLRKQMQDLGMFLLLDLVLNHTSRMHPWALEAKKGNIRYQEYYFMFPDRAVPDAYDQAMPEIFPDSAPGNFSFDAESGQWVMTVFHPYQWDLNFSNPRVLVEMVDTVLFYANLGVDILRIDAPAFIWKQLGTHCQNLPQVHILLRLIKQCVMVSTPGMALLGEAIVPPHEIIKYFGSGRFTGKECDFAYNATQMALQWDMLATGDTRIMLSSQHELSKKPEGSTWITYTRCHDDIGLGFDDSLIERSGKNPGQHRKFIYQYYTGQLDWSPARGALFSYNPKNGDARISGTLASLCGLQSAAEYRWEEGIALSIQKILLMQAHSFFLGGLPMIFCGDEVGYTNDYSFLNDPAKSYDNRWMHRPQIDWKKNKRVDVEGSSENQIFEGTRKLIHIRKTVPAVGDTGHFNWLSPYNDHVAGYRRSHVGQSFYGLFNFSGYDAYLSWQVFKDQPSPPSMLYDHWTERSVQVGDRSEFLILQPFGFYLFTAE